VVQVEPGVITKGEEQISIIKSSRQEEHPVNGNILIVLDINDYNNF